MSRAKTIALSAIGTGTAAVIALALVATITAGHSATPAVGTGVSAPAFVAKSTAAPAVTRVGETTDAKKATAPKVALGSPADYTDGVDVTATVSGHGTVTGSGPGVVAGAPYVIFTVSVHNTSSSPVDISSSVLTLRYGDDATPASPLYDGVSVHDFSGTVDAGATVSTTYAFTVPSSATTGILYVDLDGQRTPAAFSGSLR